MLARRHAVTDRFLMACLPITSEQQLSTTVEHGIVRLPCRGHRVIVAFLQLRLDQRVVKIIACPSAMPCHHVLIGGLEIFLSFLRPLSYIELHFFFNDQISLR